MQTSQDLALVYVHVQLGSLIIHHSIVLILIFIDLIDLSVSDNKLSLCAGVCVNLSTMKGSDCNRFFSVVFDSEFRT
jgi:hypothetical protein